MNSSFRLRMRTFLTMFMVLVAVLAAAVLFGMSAAPLFTAG